MSSKGPVHELRVALTVDDYDEALRFCRDALGLPVVESWDTPDGSGVLLGAGRATLEVLSKEHAESVDRIEVGEPVGSRVRFALEVDDSAATAQVLGAAGAEVLHEPVVTPWSHGNVRLRAPEGTQLTLFTPLEAGGT